MFKGGHAKPAQVQTLRTAAFDLKRSRIDQVDNSFASHCAMVVCEAEGAACRGRPASSLSDHGASSAFIDTNARVEKKLWLPSKTR